MSMLIHAQTNNYVVPLQESNTQLYQVVQDAMKEVTQNKRFVLFKIMNNEIILIKRSSKQGQEIASQLFLFTEEVFQQIDESYPKDSKEHHNTSCWESIKDHDQKNIRQESLSFINLDSQILQNPENGHKNSEEVIVLQQFNHQSKMHFEQLEEVEKDNKKGSFGLNFRQIINSYHKKRRFEQKIQKYRIQQSKYQVDIKMGLNYDPKCDSNEQKQWKVQFSNSGFRDWPNNKIGLFNINTKTRLLTIPGLPSHQTSEFIIDCKAASRMTLSQLQFGYDSSKGHRVLFGPILRCIALPSMRPQKKGKV